MRKAKIAAIFSAAFLIAMLAAFFVFSSAAVKNNPGNKEITLGGKEILGVFVVSVVAGAAATFLWVKKHPFVETLTPKMVRRAVALFPTFNQFSISYLQRRLNIKTFAVASELADELERQGYVRKLPDYRWDILRECEATRIAPQVFSMNSVDAMEGHRFEYWCAEVLRKNGFWNVEVTRGSGDQGVDVFAEKDGIKYAIQCKCYTSDLGNKPVQEVNAGKAIYHCQIGAVMTNRYFTAGAKEAAEATGILLWDRDTVQRMAQRANMV